MKQGPERARDPVAALTPRQREVLQLLAEGRSAKEIASSLSISTRTVEFHKYQMMETLGSSHQRRADPLRHQERPRRALIRGPFILVDSTPTTSEFPRSTAGLDRLQPGSAPACRKDVSQWREPLSCVLLADRHHGLTEGVRGLLETAFGTVVMVADEASLLDGAAGSSPTWRSWTCRSRGTAASTG